MISWLTLLFLISFVYALPLAHRGNTACGTFDTIPAGSYSLLTNLWGASHATSGSQCVTLDSDSLSGDPDVVRWHTVWKWADDATVENDVIKSYANIQFNGVNRQLSAIHSIRSIWKWSQKSTNAKYDVAFDLFTADSPDASHRNAEIMIWLDCSPTVWPISYIYDAEGQAAPIERSLTFAGRSWSLSAGFNGHNTVYSFIPSGGPITSFDGDLYPFLEYLVNTGYLSASEYLVVAQAGTEATRGSAVFTTSAYRMTID